MHRSILLIEQTFKQFLDDVLVDIYEKNPQELMSSEFFGIIFCKTYTFTEEIPEKLLHKM